MIVYVSYNHVTLYLWVGPQCPSAYLFQYVVVFLVGCSVWSWWEHVGTVSHVLRSSALLRIQCVVGLGFAEIGQGEGWTRLVAVLGEIKSSQLRASRSFDRLEFPKRGLLIYKMYQTVVKTRQNQAWRPKRSLHRYAVLPPHKLQVGSYCERGPCWSREGSLRSASSLSLSFLSA